MNSWLWLIVGVMFVILSIFHYVQSTKVISDFKVSDRTNDEMGRLDIFGSDIDQPIRDFTIEFNDYLQHVNRSSKIMNLISCGGYLLASLTAFFSYFLSCNNSQKIASHSRKKSPS